MTSRTDIQDMETLAHFKHKCKLGQFFKLNLAQLTKGKKNQQVPYEN